MVWFLVQLYHNQVKKRTVTATYRLLYVGRVNRSIGIEAIVHLQLLVYKMSELTEGQNHKAFGLFMI